MCTRLHCLPGHRFCNITSRLARGVHELHIVGKRAGETRGEEGVSSCPFLMCQKPKDSKMNRSLVKRTRSHTYAMQRKIRRNRAHRVTTHIKPPVEALILFSPIAHPPRLPSSPAPRMANLRVPLLRVLPWVCVHLAHHACPVTRAKTAMLSYAMQCHAMLCKRYPSLSIVCFLLAGEPYKPYSRDDTPPRMQLWFLLWNHLRFSRGSCSPVSTTI